MTEHKYAKIINEETYEVQVGVGCPDEYYIEIGMEQMDVEQAYNGKWYVAGYAPVQPEPAIDNEYQREMREKAYVAEVDPITAHIQRLRDDDPESTEIADLITERTAKREEIKARYPYSE